MIARLYRPLMIGLLPIALIACASTGPTVADEVTVPLGIDLGGSRPVAAPAPVPTSLRRAELGEGGPASHPQPSGEMQMAHGGQDDAHGTGTVNSVDPAQHKINLSHQPIPEIGWPAMTMDFPVARSVDLTAIQPGSRVNFTIEKGQSGMYEIEAIAPAGGDR
jgi:Cu/Ag efflux protein CusF